MLKMTDTGFEVECDFCDKKKQIHLFKNISIERCIYLLKKANWIADEDNQFCCLEHKTDFDYYN